MRVMKNLMFVAILFSLIGGVSFAADSYVLEHQNGGKVVIPKKGADLDELKKKGFILVGETDRKSVPAKTEITRDGEVLYKHDGPTLEK